MITIEVYRKTQGDGSPVAVLSYSGKGNTIKIESEDKKISEELTAFSNTILGLANQGLAFPDNRKQWMESLPLAETSVPYLFKLTENEIVEEDEHGNEDDEEDNREDNSEESDDNGGNEDGLEDPSDSGGEEDDSDSGGDTDRGTLDHNG